MPPQVHSVLEDPSLIKLKVPASDVEACFFPIVQSGGDYDLKVSAQSSSAPLKFDVILCSIGARYQKYCSAMSRTYLVDPPPKVLKTYELLLEMQVSEADAATRPKPERPHPFVHTHAIPLFTPCLSQDACLAVMKPGNPLSMVYDKAVSFLTENNRDDLVKTLPKNLGFAIGLDFCDGDAFLHTKNKTIFRARQVYNLSVGFHKIPLTVKDLASVSCKSDIKKLRKYSLLVADTYEVKDENDMPEQLTIAPKNVEAVIFDVHKQRAWARSGNTFFMMCFLQEFAQFPEKTRAMRKDFTKMVRKYARTRKEERQEWARGQRWVGIESDADSGGGDDGGVGGGGGDESGDDDGSEGGGNSGNDHVGDNDGGSAKEDSDDDGEEEEDGEDEEEGEVEEDEEETVMLSAVAAVEQFSQQVGLAGQDVDTTGLFKLKIDLGRSRMKFLFQSVEGEGATGGGPSKRVGEVVLQHKWIAAEERQIAFQIKVAIASGASDASLAARIGTRPDMPTMRQRFEAFQQAPSTIYRTFEAYSMKYKRMMKASDEEKGRSSNVLTVKEKGAGGRPPKLTAEELTARVSPLSVHLIAFILSSPTRTPPPA